jgi:two-component system, response regulator / RNA-binding antiterminator
LALRILVVDHNAERAAVVRQALVDVGGYLVEVAPKAGDLLTLLRTAQPDVLIVDLDLPDRDTIEQLRVATRERPRPIVMFVDQSDANMMHAAIDAGVSAYVVDGLSSSRVRPVLDVAIARFKAFDALRRELDATRGQLAERKIIDRAKGILMRAKGITEEEAYERMRRAAMNEQKKLAEIAQSIVTAAEMLK